MAINTLSQTTAMGSGSDLWILPEIEKSTWVQKLDWYLNFQIGRAEKHKDPKINPFIEHILHETGLEKPNPQKNWVKNDLNSNPKKSLLMISPNQLLPCKYVVLIPHLETTDIWIAAIRRVWHNLGRPELRVFLPKAMDPQNFITEWQEQESFENFTIVHE